MKSFAVIVITGFMASAALAQEAMDPRLNMATDQCTQSLSSVKNSIQQLEIDNAHLSNDNIAAKSQLIAMKERVRGLEVQENALNAAVARLQKADPQKANKIVELEKSLYQASQQVDAVTLQNQQMQEELTRLSAQDQELSAKLVSNEEGEEDQKPLPVVDNVNLEKLKLLKMIYNSKQHQLELRNQMSIPPAPAARPHTAAAAKP